jgi:diguanylate cyclase (GGDEF)-like protein
MASQTTGWPGLVLGTKEVTRQGIKRLLWTLLPYGFITALLWVAVYWGRAPETAARLISTYIAVGLLIFYSLLRSGWSARQAEPTLAFAQVLFSVGAMLLAYVHIEISRPIALQLLCLTWVFDMHRLQRQHVRTIAMLTLIGLSLATACALRAPLSPLQVAAEWVNLGMACISMGVLVLVSGLARRMRKQSEQQRIDLAQALTQKQELATRDGLTRALTRRHMQHLLEAEAARHKRTRQPFCVAMLDIDLFKRINDQYGHTVGDTVLITMTRLIESHLSQAAQLGRWGGEEFVLLLPQCPLSAGLHTLETLRQAVQQHDWSVHAPGLSVTFSGGISTHQLGDEVCAVLARADQALYSAKAMGRNRVHPAAQPPRKTEQVSPP